MTKNRKEALLQLLKEAQKPQNGKSLAEHFHVTRQIIVQDIAVLRADGAPILSTNRGYIYKESNVHDRNIQEYATGVDALLESDRVKYENFNYEHDLWNY